MKTAKYILDENKPWINETFEALSKKLEVSAVRSRYKTPHLVDENGMYYEKNPSDPVWWCKGFFGGIMAMMYAYTGNEEYLKTAKETEKILKETLITYPDKVHHDVGFMYHITAGAIHRLTGSQESRALNILAAQTLASRFVLGGDFIRAWNNPNYGMPSTNFTIIDCMLNLPLLYWASEELGDDRFARMAMAHADSTIKYHIRPDGSVIHIVVHDRETGECVKTIGGQGAFDGSSWSRGQAWALYGFVLSYLSTKEQRYLDAAKRVANYFIAATADDWIPRGDFRVADNAPLSTEGVVYDTSAGTCAACGLIDLANILPEGEGGMYMNAAIKMMRAMSDAFIDLDPSRDGFLYGTSARYPTNGDMKKADANTSIIYGEFYFVEALLKLKGSTFNPWVK
ncbi:MAG: glycoside hydrolase family 88 protein [Clostridia bacterium]|nr:glycoside hydrolase family 88 protein [Clostridia bacterium]